MRLPIRTRGVLAGIATLVISPIVIGVMTSKVNPSLALTSASPVTISNTHTTSRIGQLHAEAVLTPKPSLLPPPVAVPAPTPAPIKAIATPTSKPKSPVPAAPPVNYPPGSIEGIITAAANAHGVSSAWMIKIAACESGLRPTAYNPAGPYVGLFQFLPSTFKAHGGTNIYDPVQQSQITATMLAAGQSRAWGCA